MAFPMIKMIFSCFMGDLPLSFLELASLIMAKKVHWAHEINVIVIPARKNTSVPSKVSVKKENLGLEKAKHMSSSCLLLYMFQKW
jgi:hypothetical protein